MRVEFLILLCFVLRNLLFDWDPASALLEFSVLLKNDYCRIILCCGTVSRACWELVLLAQLFLGLPCLDDVSCDVVSLKNPPSRCSLPQSLLVRLAMSSSSPPFFLFSPLLISLRLMVFVRSVFNSGERAGGAICGFWRASLLVIIFPGVILDEAKAHCCIITRGRLGFPIIEGVLGGNNSTMGLRKTIVDFFTDNSMKKLAPRTMLGLVLHIVWL